LGLADMKEKLKILSVPTTTAPLHNLSSINGGDRGNGISHNGNGRYAVAMLHESLIVRHSHQLCNDIEKAAVHLVVLTDTALTTEEVVCKYGLNAIACISCKASLQEVFQCVLDVTATQESFNTRSLTNCSSQCASQDDFGEAGDGGDKFDMGGASGKIFSAPFSKKSSSSKRISPLHTTRRGGSAYFRNVNSEKAGRNEKIRAYEGMVQKWQSLLKRFEYEARGISAGAGSDSPLPGNLLKSDDAIVSSILEGCRQRVLTVKSEDPHTAGMPVMHVDYNMKKANGGSEMENNKRDNLHNQNKIDKTKKIIEKADSFEGNVFVDEITIPSESALQSFEDLKKEYTKNKKMKKENEKKKSVRINDNAARFVSEVDKSFQRMKPTLVGNVETVDQCDYWRVMGSLDEGKRRAKNVVELFLPSVKILRKQIRECNYSEVQDLCAIFSLKSADHGLHRLNCWYCTLQEVTGIVISHLINTSREPSSSLQHVNAPRSLSTSDLDASSSPSGYIDGGTTRKPGQNPFGHYPHTLEMDFDNERFLNNNDHFNNAYGKSESNLNKIEILNIRVVEILVEMIDAIELAIWDSAVD